MYALDIQTVVVFLILIGISFYLNKKMSEFLHEKQKVERDLDKQAREDINQTLTNVKFLKLYGWKDLFFNRCVQSQNKLKANKDHMQLFHKSNEFFNEINNYMIPVLTFTMFMYNSDNRNGSRMLSLAAFQTTTFYFEKLSGLINSLAHELNWLSEMKLSLKNLQNFFMCDEM